MNSTNNPTYSVAIEDGELTPPPSPLPFYPEDNILYFDERQPEPMEAVNLDDQPTTLASATIIPNFLAYVHSHPDKNDIFNILTKLANNQIQFTYQGGTSVVDLHYIQEISMCSTRQKIELTVSALETSFTFQDELDNIYKRGNRHSVQFANDFAKLNNHTKSLFEHDPNETIINLRKHIENIAMHLKREVEKKFPSQSSSTLFSEKKSFTSNISAKETHSSATTKSRQFK